MPLKFRDFGISVRWAQPITGDRRYCFQKNWRLKLNDGNVGLEDEEAPPPQRKAIYEIDLIDLVRDVWGGRYLIVCLLFLSFLLAMFLVTFGQRTYTASMLVSPPDQTGSQALSGALSQVAGAANLLGIGIGGGDNPTLAKYSAVLESYDLADAMLKHDELKTMLFGPGWDPKSRRWNRPEGVIFNTKDFLKGVIGLPRWTPPTPYTMRAVLSSALHLTPDKQKGFLTISTTAPSPDRAVKLLNVVYQEADQLLREASKERSQNRIAYLRAQLGGITLQDQRTAIINVLSIEEQRLMMASADKSVAIEIIDPPYAPPIPTSPQPRVVLMNNAFLALMLGAFLSIIYGLRQRDVRRKATAASIHQVPPTSIDAAAARLLRKWLHRA